MNKEKANIIRNFFFSVKKIFKADKIFVFESLLQAIISAMTAYMASYILKIAVDGLETGKEFKDVMINVTTVVIVLLILAIINSFCWNDISYRKNKISAILTKEYYLKSLETDYEKFELPEAQDTFEKGGRALGGYNGMVGLFSNMITTISQVLVFAIGCAIIFSVSIWLIVITVGLAIIKLILKDYNTKKAKTNFYDKTPGLWRRITYTDNISRNLTIGKDLRIYEMDKFIDEERETTVKEFLKLFKKEEIRKNIINGLITILNIFDEVFLYVFVVYEVLHNNMSIADFSFVISSIRTLRNSLTTIIYNYSNNLNYSLQVNDYRKLINMDLSVDKNLKEYEAESIEIEFKNVSYSYYMQEGYSLKNVSFKIKKGERIALVGNNGAGKTTLVKMLCGFYHPTEGEILINGVNIETIDRNSLAKLIAPVFQDTNHYAISVKENIAMSKTAGIDDKKIKNAINLTDLKEKIDKLPNGVDTIITRELEDNGIELSGGENQKLSIARAVYKNSPLIILDEPTSALDPLAEYNLYNNFNNIIKDHSAIFISHRLSSTRFCDRIFFLEEGELKEVGTHSELMSYDSKYKKLFDMQAEYYKGGQNNED